MLLLVVVVVVAAVAVVVIVGLLTVVGRKAGLANRTFVYNEYIKAYGRAKEYDKMWSKYEVLIVIIVIVIIVIIVITIIISSHFMNIFISSWFCLKLTGLLL